MANDMHRIVCDFVYAKKAQNVISMNPEFRNKDDMIRRMWQEAYYPDNMGNGFGEYPRNILSYTITDETTGEVLYSSPTGDRPATN